MMITQAMPSGERVSVSTPNDPTGGPEGPVEGQPQGPVPGQPQPGGAYPPQPPPPGAGSYPPPPPPEQYQAQPSAGDAIGYGWRAFMKQPGTLVLLALIVLIVQGVLSYISRQSDSTAGMILWSIVGWVISALLTVGVIRAALAVLDGRRPEVGMLFQPEGLVSYLLASIVVGVCVAVGLVLLIIPGLIVLFLFQFYGFAVVDEQAAPMASLSRSVRVTTSNVGPVLLFDLIGIAVLILGALLLGVGLLVAYPVVIIGAAYLWRRLTVGQVAPIT